jgi:hypothetical protein
MLKIQAALSCGDKDVQSPHDYILEFAITDFKLPGRSLNQLIG